jgi:hypothetical protein
LAKFVVYTYIYIFAIRRRRVNITILLIYWKVKLKEKFVIHTKKTQMLIMENIGKFRR